MGSLGAPELILIIAVVLLLFGGKKIPELMRGLGKGVKEFKDATNGESSTTTPPPPPPASAPEERNNVHPL